jgi:hypothetical protein
MHALLVQRAGAQRASRWLLVDEYGALAVRTVTLPHGRGFGGFVRHVLGRARGERSLATSACLRMPLNERPGPDATRRSHREGLGSVVRGGFKEAATRPPSCSCACLGARTSARVRAASRDSTCYSGRAWFHIRPLRRRGRRCTAWSAAGAAGRLRPGTHPLPRSSHPSAGSCGRSMGQTPRTYFERIWGPVHS